MMHCDQENITNSDEHMRALMSYLKSPVSLLQWVQYGRKSCVQTDDNIFLFFFYFWSFCRYEGQESTTAVCWELICKRRSNCLWGLNGTVANWMNDPKGEFRREQNKSEHVLAKLAHFRCIKAKIIYIFIYIYGGCIYIYEYIYIYIWFAFKTHLLACI